MGERRDRLAEAVDLIRQLWTGDLVTNRSTNVAVERLRLMTRPATPPPIYLASSGARSARLAGEIGDGLIGVTPSAELVEVFRSAGGSGKRCAGQLHVSVAATVEAAQDTAQAWWPNGAVPPSVLTELATPAEFEAVAEASTLDRITDSVVCATGAAPIVAAIDRFIGAGYDTVYLHHGSATHTLSAINGSVGR